jgi:predicted dehydrogenase
MPFNPITVGLVGFGMSGRIFHAPFIHAHPAFRLKSVVERHGTEAKSLYHNVEVFKDFSSLVKDPEIDLVVLGVPNDLHFTMAREVLQAGKHVVVEKPFTPSTREADELIRTADDNGRHLFVYQNRRWDGDFLTVQKLLGEGVLGEVLNYSASFNRYRPVPAGKAWREEPRPGSGVLFDLAPHLVDQALILFGLPEALFGDVRTQRTGGKVDDYFNLALYYGELKVSLEAGVFVREPGPRYAIHGRQGSFVKYGLDPQEEALKRGISPGGNDWGEEGESGFGLLYTELGGKIIREKVRTLPGNYMGFYDNVADVINGRAPMAVTPLQARNVVRILELALESSEQRKVIDYIG